MSHLLLAGAASATSVLAITVIFQLLRVERRAVTMITLFVVTLPAFALAHVLTPRDLGFYYVVATSVSVRILITLRHAPGQALPLSALETMFASTEMLQGRLETMVTYGHVSRQGDLFAIARKGRVIACSFRFIKAAWRLGPGGRPHLV